MAKYQVTIHEHVIYDHWVEASSKEEAQELAEDAISDGNDAGWKLDAMAGWTEVGDIYLDDELI